MFVSHNERKVGSQITGAHSYKKPKAKKIFNVLFCVSQAVEELLVELDVNKKSIVVGNSRVSICLTIRWTNTLLS